MSDTARLADRLRHPLARFFGVLLVGYAAWFLLYELWIGPDGRLDAWLSLHVAALAGGMLNVVGLEPLLQGRHLWLEGVPGVLVDDSCNAISSQGLFVAFVLAFPGAWAARLWFIPLGILAIHATNGVRVAALLMIQERAPAYFEIVHELGVVLFFYTAIFALWMVWVRIGDGSALRPAPRPVVAA